MGKSEKEENEDTEMAEKYKEKWEKERELFRGRIASFISRMHIIQGNRRFSPWKGSVVDSVAGAFLTQNVSDISSSSAFMSLAAHYPNRDISSKMSVPSVESDSIDKRQIKNLSTEEKEKEVNRKEVVMNFLIRKTEKEGYSVNHRDNIRKLCAQFDDKMRTDDTTSSALDWNAVSSSHVDDISKAITDRGMDKKLAERIKNCIDLLKKELGSIDLEWLRNAPPENAKEYLLSIYGLGLKSVECIRLLTLQHQAFPPDI
ncbi:unnamed protein product [Cuscuta epithymum]|uniref:HhH-GPD domain-containing protein n=1 Tax=Cuscuta epithymum TaxID=186058 RepID=A0AAV0FLS1_9ASTE|nr:unnamed protein product [Cuscuta epithymum]